MQSVEYIKAGLPKCKNVELAEIIRDAQGRIESHMLGNPEVDDYVIRQQKIIDLALEELEKRR